MSTVPARRTRLEQPPPAPGTVEVRVQGRPEDVDAAERELGDRFGLGTRLWKRRRYPDRNGVTVRSYYVLDLRKQPGQPSNEEKPHHG